MEGENKLSKKNEMLADYLYKVSVAVIVGVVFTAITEVYRHIDDITSNVQYASLGLVIVGLVTAASCAYIAYLLTTKI